MPRHQQRRDEFIARMSREGMPLDTIRAVLRASATLQRLAEAQCNGDWPYNGDRDRPGGRSQPGEAERWDRRYAVCPDCESSCAVSVLRRVPMISEGPKGRTYYKRVCPDCRTSDRLRATLTGSGWTPVFQGDPRGCVVKLARSLQRCDKCQDRPGKNGLGQPCAYCDGLTGYRPYPSEDIQNGRAEARGDVIGVPA